MRERTYEITVRLLVEILGSVWQLLKRHFAKHDTSEEGGQYVDAAITSIDEKVSQLFSHNDLPPPAAKAIAAAEPKKARGFPQYPYLVTERDNTAVTKLVIRFVDFCCESTKPRVKVEINGCKFTFSECLACLHLWLIFNNYTYSDDNNVAAYRRYLEVTCVGVNLPSIQSFNRVCGPLMSLPCEISKMTKEKLSRCDMEEEELIRIKALYAFVQLYFQEISP